MNSKDTDQAITQAGAVELNEDQLDDASGGTALPSPNTYQQGAKIAAKPVRTSIPTAPPSAQYTYDSKGTKFLPTTKL